MNLFALQCIFHLANLQKPATNSEYAFHSKLSHIFRRLILSLAGFIICHPFGKLQARPPHCGLFSIQRSHTKTDFIKITEMTLNLNYFVP